MMFDVSDVDAAVLLVLFWLLRKIISVHLHQVMI